jgi:hypothetical protein
VLLLSCTCAATLQRLGVADTINQAHIDKRQQCHVCIIGQGSWAMRLVHCILHSVDGWRSRVLPLTLCGQQCKPIR